MKMSTKAEAIALAENKVWEYRKKGEWYRVKVYPIFKQVWVETDTHKPICVYFYEGE